MANLVNLDCEETEVAEESHALGGLIPLVLLDEKSAFNPPAISGTEVTEGMDVEPADGTAGDPSLFAVFGVNRVFICNFFESLREHLGASLCM